MKGTLILAAAAFGAGIGIGFLLFEGRAAEPRASGSRGLAKTVNQAEPPAAETKSIGIWLGSVDVPAVEGGTGTITGRVMADDGPVAGVVVRAKGAIPYPSTLYSHFRPGEPAPPESTLAERTRAWVEHQKRVDAVRGEATTGDDGHYTISGLAEGIRFGIEAFAEGYAIQQVNHRHTVEVGEQADFTARRVFRVWVRVEFPAGIEASDELGVMVNSKDRSSNYAGSQLLQGRSWIRLTEGRHGLSAYQGTYLSSEFVEVEVAGDLAEPVVLTLISRPAVLVRPTCRGGTPLGRQLQVRMLRYEGEPPDDERLRRSALTQGVSPHSPVAGFYKLERGSYVVGVAMDRRGPILARKTVEVLDGPVRVDLEFPPFAAADCVHLTVLDPDGEKIHDPRFSTAYRYEGGSTSGGSAVIRLDDGTFLVQHHAHKKQDKTGTYAVTVRTKEYGNREVTYKLGGEREFTIRFGRPAFLDLFIDGYSESKLAGHLTVFLKPKTGSRGGHNSRPKTDRQSFGPVEPGEYTVELTASTGEHGSLPAGSFDVSLREGKNERRIPVPAVHELVVLAPGVKKGERRLELRPAAGNRRSVYLAVGADGKATLPRVPAGDYELISRGGRYAKMAIHVPGPAIVRFEPVEPDAFEVTITDEAGDFAKAGLRTGDIVVGVDGMEFENLRQAQALLMGAMAKERAKLTIQRAGTRFEVEIAGKKMMEGGPKAMGGNLEPVAR